MGQGGFGCVVRRVARGVVVFFGLLALAAFGPAALAQPASITVPTDKDNTLYEDFEGAISNGKGQHFFVGTTTSRNIRRGVISFDLSLIPPESTVTQVSLRLYMSRTRASSQPVTVHRALASWGEGDSRGFGEEGSGDISKTDDATWLHRFWPNTMWTNQGGDFVATPSATTTVGGVSFYTWSSAGLTADVQAWVSNPAANFGWVLKTTETADRTAKRFDTKENAITTQRPSLTITYTPPAGAGACCLPTGQCVVMTEATCVGAGGTFRGAGAACTPSPCAQASGACCLRNGTCDVMMATACAAAQGTYQGDDTSCSGRNCPIVLEPFVDALPLPGVAQPTSGQPGDTAHYDLAIRQFTQQLHRDLPATKVWGYDSSYPGPTIEARRGRQVTVRWTNDLRDDLGDLLVAHALSVDTCLHGPDMNGDVPLTVVHLHGGRVAPESDGNPEATFAPGQTSTLYTYPNEQRAATLWYHDHALGLTRLNVYMGLAGFYLLRDAQEDALDLPRGEYEIPLAIQDRSFKPDGSLLYHDQWRDQFFGDFLLVNGKIWPFLNVDRGKYRFRLLNGSSSRAYTLSLSNSASFRHIGSDLGLLAAPITTSTITILPGERADVVMDFASYAPGTELILTNSAPAPFTGQPGSGAIPNVMKFIVRDRTGHTRLVPRTLASVPRTPEYLASRERTFELIGATGGCGSDPMWMINGLGWDDVTEYPRLGSYEIWSWVNRSPIVHPMHKHLVSLQILDRQEFQIVNNRVVPTGPRFPPPAGESGWKDTVQTYPNQITRTIARFDGYTGSYAYHCHILEHEDHEMMRRFEVVCTADYDDGSGTGQPDGGVTVDDVLYFLDLFMEGDKRADVDDGSMTGLPDGGVTIDDLLYFFERYAAGC